jgi:hypothetical protein
MGFAGLMQRSSGVDDIIKKFLPSGTTSVLAEEKNEDEEIA